MVISIMTEITPKCECRRFVCEPIREVEDGILVPSDKMRIRFHKSELGHIDYSDIIESGVVTCEIKEAGQHKALQPRLLGAISLKAITNEFIEAKGWGNEK